jgi:hypothetical protein
MSEQNTDSDKVTQAIQDLRQIDAHVLDPISFHCLEALHHRATAYEGNVRRILDIRVLELAHTLAKRAAQTRQTAYSVGAEQHRPAEHESLQDLVRYLAHNSAPVHMEVVDGESPRAPTELKAVAIFRNTWSKLSVNKRVETALKNGPQNAGPINSHMVALRSLELMRDISPDYLNRFMTHIDTLMLLDSAGKELKQKRTRAR